MSKRINLEATKTYASEASAEKAVEKIFPQADGRNLRYIIMRTADNRFFPIFVNANEAMQHGVHFHFHVVG